MSTRSNVLVKDDSSRVMFYRHSDGYPSGHEILMRYMQEVKEGNLRNNVSQSSGWIVVYGYLESQKDNERWAKKGYSTNFSDWKVGYYEPCDYNNTDIEFFYICDLAKMQIQIFEANLWKAKLGKHGLMDDKMIEKAIKNKWLSLIATITEFKDLKKLQELDK